VTRKSIYDVVIVGSGPTGGYAAKLLSEAGLRVIVLDAGRPLLQSRALLACDALRRRLGYQIELDPAAVRRQPVQSSCYAWPLHPRAFVDDLDNPYTTEPGQPFVWIRSRHVGGRMIVRGHGLQFYRFSDLDFTAGDRDGASPSWPLSYSSLVPHYERLERWMRIRGTCDQLPQLPDSVLWRERRLNEAERLLLEGLTRTWRDRRLIPGRTAAPVIPVREATATVKCRLRTNAVVSRVLVDPRTANVSGIEFVDRLTRRTREVRARVVVLCASAIESARLLLASATPQHPEGLANSSGAVGRYLMDHTHLTGMRGVLPLVRPVALASWAYVPRFRNLGARHPSFVRGYGMQVFTMWRECAVTSFGEMLPHPDNRVTLDRDRTDRWGVPIAHVACAHRENELAMAPDQINACAELLRAARIEAARVSPTLSPAGLACHEVGTARMGRDPRTSVLNEFCQSWDATRLFVMDGSCFVSQGAQNPTLTMMAIAARSCDYLIDACRRREL
jgi:choline dehydrogenase-like flavoprotein